METEKICDHPKAKEKEKSEEDQRSIRFALELKESNDKYFPEFSFKELLRSATVGEGKEKDLPVDGDDDHDKLQALAKKFEEKYGPKQKHKKKRRERIQDLIDVTYGYDETDPFVDNSEAYDELIPADWTTEHGGFYINQGGLNFKPISSDDSDGEDFKGVKKRKTPKKLKDPNKVKKVKDSGDKERKRKHLTPDKEKKPRKIRLISGDKEKKHRKKLNMGGPTSVTNSASSLLVKMISSVSTITTTTASSTSQVTSPSSLSSISLASVGTSNATPALSTEGSPQEKSNIKTEVSDEVAKGSEHSLMAQDANASNSPSVVNQNGLSTGLSTEDFVPKLPSYLPLSVEACVQKLKLAANNAVDEGKCKFFNKDVNQLLLEIETKSRELSCRVRSGIYDYLAFYLPCTKETLLKRAKKLLLTDQAGRLREPMAKLKAAINKVMPEQIKAFEEEVRQHVEEQSKTSGVEEQSPEDKKKELFKSAMEVDDDGEKPDEVTTPTNPSTPSTEEKTKKALPKRKFVWTDEIRELLSDVVTLRVKLFEMSKTRTTSAEEYLKEFFESEVKPLWPKGWMTSRILFKESKSVHTRVTSTQFKPKKVPGPKKQGEPLSLSDIMDSSSQSEPKEEPKTQITTTTPSIINATTTANPTTTSTSTKLVKEEHAAMTATATTSVTKTLPKLNAGALSMLKAKIIQVNYPGVLGKTNLLSQAGTKPVSALILSTKSTATTTFATTTSTSVTMATMQAKPSILLGLSTSKAAVSLSASNPPTTVALTTKPSVAMVTTSTPVSLTTNVPKPVVVNRLSVESRGAVTKVESTVDKRPEQRIGVMTTNSLLQQQQQPQRQLQQQQQQQQQPQHQLQQQQPQPQHQQQQQQPQPPHQQHQQQQQPPHQQQQQQQQPPHQQQQQQLQPQHQQQQQQQPQYQQQQQSQHQQQQQREQHHQSIKSPVSCLGQLSSMTFTSGQPQFHQKQPVQTKPQYHQPVTVSSTNQAMKSQPVTILDFADMMSSETQDDPTQEINSIQPSQFISKSPSPQKSKETVISVTSKVGNTGVVSPQRAPQQNTIYTSPSSILRSPSQMTQARNTMSQSNAVLANMLMSMGNPSMSNLQNKFIDLNAASIINQQRQQAANSKTILDSITSPSRMTMDMHTSSVPLSHPMISRQLSNPTQTGSVFNSLQQPTLSMLGHTNLPVKNTSPLSHLGMVPDAVPSSLMHMNRPLQQQQQQQQQQAQQQQQQSSIVMPSNPFNPDPNHNPTGGHPPSSFMPRFS